MIYLAMPKTWDADGRAGKASTTFIYMSSKAARSRCAGLCHCAKHLGSKLSTMIHRGQGGRTQQSGVRVWGSGTLMGSINSTTPVRFALPRNMPQIPKEAVIGSSSQEGES